MNQILFLGIENHFPIVPNNETDPRSSCLQLINLFPTFWGQVVNSASFWQKQGTAVECLKSQGEMSSLQVEADCALCYDIGLSVMLPMLQF